VNIGYSLAGAIVLQSRPLVPAYIVPIVSGIQHKLSITCCATIGLSYFIRTQSCWIEKSQVTHLGGTLAPEGCHCLAANVRVFAKAGNSLIVKPGTNAHLKICC
jgi:hypothetical protein